MSQYYGLRLILQVLGHRLVCVDRGKLLLHGHCGLSGLIAGIRILNQATSGHDSRKSDYN